MKHSAGGWEGGGVQGGVRLFAPSDDKPTRSEITEHLPVMDARLQTCDRGDRQQAGWLTLLLLADQLTCGKFPSTN